MRLQNQNSKPPMNRVPRLLFIALLGLLTFSACKTDPKKEAVTYKRTNNTVLARLRAEPDRINTVLTTDNYARQIGDYIFLYLFTVNPKTYAYEPLLIKSLPTTTDITEGPYAGGVAYTFELLDEAVWDNGTPVTANDYVFTLKATLNPRVQAQQLRPFLEHIRDVQIDANNPKKFTVLTNQKYILGMEAIGNTIPVLPEYIFDPNGLLKNVSLTEMTDTSKVEKLAQSNPALQQFADVFNSPDASRSKEYLIGCGPYRFEEWQTGQKVVLVKKENWWGDKLASKYPALTALPDRLEYLIIPEPATALAALRSEDLDACSEIDPKDFIEIRDAELTKKVYNFYTPPSLAASSLYFNTKNPKLSDKRVRRALAHAINVDEIIKTVYNGFAERIAVPVNPGADYYNKDLKLIEFDIQKAKDLLAEAGWKDTNNNGIADKMINGKLEELNLSCMISSSSETGKNMLLLFQGTLKQAGVNLEIVPREFRAMMNEVRNDNFEMAASGRTMTPTLWEPKQDWHSEATQGGSNHSNFQNAAADKLMDQIQVTLDKSQRDALYKQLQQILYDEQPCIFLFQPTSRIVIHKRFKADASAIPPGYFPAQFQLDLDN